MHEATTQRLEHLLGGLSYGADQEHVSESFLIVAIPLRECPARVLPRPVHAGLLAPGPRVARPLPDARVVGERLEPVHAPEPPPDSLGRCQQLGVVPERARGEHRVHPLARAAATLQLRPGLLVGQGVEIPC